MAPLSNREVVERYAKALVASDFDSQDALLADDVTDDYPQSGERLRGRVNIRRVAEQYPGRKDSGDLATKVDRVIGSEDRLVLTPNLTPMRVIGMGDQYVGTGEVTYPDGKTWHIVQLMELRNGKIAKLTTYFAAPFDAPPWRAGWVERMPGR
ncbi:MAG: nuclear transport factor 2 family protein [Candidatus Limnocylindria bacterium]